MGTYSLRNIAVAAALGITAVVLTMIYVAGTRSNAAGGGALVTVYVATRDIPANSTGTRLAANGAIARASVPEARVVPGAVRSPGELNGLVTVEEVYRGEQLTTHQLAPLRARGVVSGLRGPLRVLAVAGDAQQLLVGMAKSGDRVDVLASVKVGDHDQAVSRIILRNLLLLRGPHATGDDKSAASDQTYAAALELTDAQAERLYYALQNGDWSLMLRPVLHPGQSWSRPQTAESLAGGAG
jgi:Flp pilus assembly protein CpaB